MRSRTAVLSGKYVVRVEGHMHFFCLKVRVICVITTIALLAMVGSLGPVSAQSGSGGRHNAVSKTKVEDRGSNSGELELLSVQGNVSMLAGAGGNITVQAGRDGILLVDTGLATMSDKVLETLQRSLKGQVTYIVNTDERSDHIGGNEAFAKTGEHLAINRAAAANVMIVGFSTIL